MRRSSNDTVEFDEMVASVIPTGPTISDIIGERDLDDWLGDDECIKHLKVVGKGGKSL